MLFRYVALGQYDVVSLDATHRYIGLVEFQLLRLPTLFGEAQDDHFPTLSKCVPWVKDFAWFAESASLVNIRRVTSTNASRPFELFPRALFWTVLLAVAGCRKPTPQSAPVKEMPVKALVVSSPDGLLFTFADENGAFQTVDTRDGVPAHARKMVRVVDPAQPPVDSENVFVLDLTELERKSPVTTQMVPRARFETQSLAQLMPGESSSLGAGNGADGGVEPAVRSPAGTARVVLYGTTWCGACRTARQYFVQNGIAFVDKDVEKDAAAAAELRDKATRLGVSADRVPVLDIGGRLLIGFDPARVQRMLESTAI